MTDAHPRPVSTVPERANLVQTSSSDVDEAQSLLNRFYYPIALGLPEGADNFGLDLEVIQLGPLTIGRLHFGASLTMLASHLDGYHVTMPVNGRTVTRNAGNEVVANPGRAAVFRPGGPVFSWHEALSTEIDIKIDRTALEGELAALLGRTVDLPIDLPPAMDVLDGHGQSWRRLVQMLSGEMTYADSLIHQPLIAERVRHSVLSGLLLSMPHRYHDELRSQAQAGAPRAIQRAVDAIQAEPERAFSVADLAVTAGMSVRSLQEGFRRHVGNAPMAYLQRVRLVRAHETLRDAYPAEMTVAAVAHRWGFAHLGRFASTYRTMFGVPPSETLRRTR